MTQVSLSALDAIKRKAKTLKRDYPKLSHTQRLDIASRELLKVSNYHEAKTACTKYIESHLAVRGAIAECSFCGLSFSTDFRDDVSSHEARHIEHEKAHRALGYRPAPYRVREAQKTLAYAELDADNPLTVQVEGALRLIRAHFDRSLETAINGRYWREHPTFDEYIAMTDDYLGTIPPGVMKEIRTRYGRTLGQIAEGRSYWHPA